MSAAESPAELLDRLHHEREQDRRRQERPVNAAAAVTGGRDYEPTREELRVGLELLDQLHPTELHDGDRRGMDRIFAEYVRRNRPTIQRVAHPAQWERFGKRAGPLRNEEMAAACPAGLIAFPGGRGTEHCIRAFLHLGRTVLLVEDEVDRRRRDVERDHLGLWGV